MSNLVNDELMENLLEMFIEAGYTEEEAEKAVLEAMDVKGL
jgi:predicted metal-binding transcription factor (methanogenesis marker protein 9)